MEEFGEASGTASCDENSTNHAADLGLMVGINYGLGDPTSLIPFSHILRFDWQEENIEASMFFLQLPPTVPMIKRSAAVDDHEVKQSSRASVEKTCKLEDLPAGQMGKMLVYRSGAVKLKLGETLYDVSNQEKHHKPIPPPPPTPPPIKRRRGERDVLPLNSWIHISFCSISDYRNGCRSPQVWIVYLPKMS